MLLFQRKCIKIFLKRIPLFLVILFITSVIAQAQIQTNVPALKEVYKNDFYIGCLLSYPHVGFPDDPKVTGQSNVVSPTGGALIKFHMNSMSPGNNMKPQYTIDLNASAAAYNSASTTQAKDLADVNPVVRFNGNLIAQLNWAKRQGFTFRGHTLVWHSQTPGTAFFRTGYSATGTRLSKEKMTKRMENYIKEVMRILHEGWPGLLSAMDVVNEAVNDNSGTDRTSNNEWYETFGDNTFIMKAFEFSRKYSVQYGETQMKLYYNDYNSHQSGKADGIVRICKPIFDAGYLDGIGMQDHDQYNSPSASQWIASYDKFFPICTEMTVTELDVKPSSTTLSASVLTSQANQYAMLFKCFVERSYFSGRGKIISVCKDGLNDQYAFVANASLWDNQNQCKPAFYASVEVGINYNRLDSLIASADSIKNANYTSESWARFDAAYTNAKSRLSQNYSYTIPAHTYLKEAIDTFHAAVTGLEKVVVSVSDDEIIPGSFSLSQNYPNPFNPETTITYQLPAEGYVSLKVYDVLGNEVAVLVDEFKNAGKYNINFNAMQVIKNTQLTSGTYFYQLKVNNFLETKKFVLLK